MTRHLWLLFGEAGGDTLPGILYAAGAGALGGIRDNQRQPLADPVEVFVIRQEAAAADPLLRGYAALADERGTDAESSAPSLRVRPLTVPAPSGDISGLVGLVGLIRQGFQSAYGEDALTQPADAAFRHRGDLSLLMWCRQWMDADAVLPAAIRQAVQQEGDSREEDEALRVFLLCAADDPFGVSGALSAAAWAKKHGADTGVPTHASLGLYLPSPAQETEAAIGTDGLTACIHALQGGMGDPMLDCVYPLGFPAPCAGTHKSPFLQLLMTAALQDSLQGQPCAGKVRLLLHPGAAFAWDTLSPDWETLWQSFVIRCMHLVLSPPSMQHAQYVSARGFAEGFFLWLESVGQDMPAPFRLGKAMEGAAGNAAGALRTLLGQVSVKALMEYDAASSGMLEEKMVHRTAAARETSAEQMLRAIEERKATLDAACAALEKHWRLIGGAARETVIRRTWARVTAAWTEADRQRRTLLQQIEGAAEASLPAALQGSAGRNKLSKLEKHTLMLRAQLDACETMLEEAKEKRRELPVFPGETRFDLCGLSKDEFDWIRRLFALPQGHRLREQAVLSLHRWLERQPALTQANHPETAERSVVPPAPMIPAGMLRLEVEGDRLGFVELPDLDKLVPAAFPHHVAHPAPMAIALEQAMQHPEDHPELVAHWRGALATALLVDGWKQDRHRLNLRLREMPPDTLQRHGLAWMGVRFSPYWVTLGDVKHTWVIGQADEAMALIPMVPGSKSLKGLPSRIAWIAADGSRFLDPAPCLHPVDRARLLRRLGALRCMTGLSEGVRQALDAWVSALSAADAPWQQAAEDVLDEQFEELLLRMTAVYGLSGLHGYEGLSRQEDRFIQPVQPNPLLALLRKDDCALPEEDGLNVSEPAVTYLWEGIPFARERAGIGLEGTGHPGETGVMDGFAQQVEVLLHQSPRWRGVLKQRLAQASAGGAVSLCDGFRHRLIQRLTLLDALPADAHVAELTAPWDESSPAVRMLLDEMLGVQLSANLLDERILLAEGEGLPSGFPVAMAGERLPLTACLPLSERWYPVLLPTLPDEAPPVQMEVDACAVTASQEDILVSVELVGSGRLRVTRRYDASACVLAEGASLPGVTLSPALRLPAARWRRYTLRTQDAPGFQAAVWQLGSWLPLSGGAAAAEFFPEWLQVTCTSYGVPFTNVLPLCRCVMDIPRKGSAVVGADLGSAAVGVMVRLGTDHLPAKLRDSTEVLLGQPEERPAPREIGPLFDFGWGRDGALYPADLCLRDVLGDGSAQRQRDLLWSLREDRLEMIAGFLRVLLEKISLFVTLVGGEDVVWHFSLPALLPDSRRAELGQLLTTLTEMAAAQTGLSITYGMAGCLLIRDVDALGYVYRGEEAGRHRGSVLMADVGAHGLSISLWLRGMSKRIEGFCLPMGVRTLLLQWMIRRPDTMLEDRHVLGEDREDLRETEESVDLLRRSVGSLSVLERAKGMVDAFLGERVQATAQSQALQGDGQSVLHGLILLYFSWNFAMMGQMVEAASSDALLNDRLPPHLPIRMCGRGSLLKAVLPPHLQQQMEGFLRLPRVTGNPVAVMEVTHSPFPKRETALGLSMMTQAEMETARTPFVLSAPALFQRNRAEGLMAFMGAFLRHFSILFPEATALILPGWMEQSAQPLLSDCAVQAIRRWAVSAAAKEELSWMECVSTGLTFLLEDHGAD